METLNDAAAGRKETPTARLVLSVDAPRADWLAARRDGITATDLVAILGQSNYKTAFDVWADKAMPAADDNAAGEAAFWGTRLEEPVAQAWAEKHNLKIRRVGLVANEEHPWAMASLDRLVTGCTDGRCALEVKTRSLFVSDQWERELPADVETQVQWQLLVTGLDHIHVAALIGGQRMVEHKVTANPAAWLKMHEAANIVWQSVQDKTPPTLPAELWTSDFLDKRYPERQGEIEVPADTLTFIREYQDVLIAIKHFEDRKAEIRTQLVGALGEFEIATIDGQNAYSYKSSTTRRLDSKALKAKYPDIESDDTVWNTTTTRTLRVTLKEGNK
jgi:putative phage-type endonuclease